ncbi:MAG: hypothetical protein A2X28_08205 [Elusimicrobia bacterium GWA2_56_46]|nr:MAG: hypothetical protein A2X28_08205 [Elusimicrobia bacterium GWA2_56_46]OGR54263.1 MAG: hypothetical protein A2X39_03505 [Elusimicrobia bacterium GWC2_56_31]HBB67192.1 hypothetical protein [Elusimicrobiota bacterium]HBW22453.1 hypothetical protein [Elusimicrobiota bacterium]
MNLIATVADLVDGPRDFIDRTGIREMGHVGLLGYLSGTLSIFLFLRMFSAVPPGIFSFLNVLVFVLGVNFCFAAGIHLFLEMTGAGGGALKLFFLFGVTEFFWALLIPLGFLASLGYLNPGADCLLCFIIVILARISVMRRLYLISRKKALLSLGLPYAALLAGFFMVFVYAIFYLVWLVV